MTIYCVQVLRQDGVVLIHDCRPPLALGLGGCGVARRATRAYGNRKEHRDESDAPGQPPGTPTIIKYQFVLWFMAHEGRLT